MSPPSVPKLVIMICGVLEFGSFEPIVGRDLGA